MIRELNIENLIVSLTTEEGGVRAKSDNENVLLPNQNIDNLDDLVRHNFKVVKTHYEKLFRNGENLLNVTDVYCLSLSIVLHYLYLYNSWKIMYKNQENRDLSFDEKDFNNPSTHDIIFHYFKSRYPDSWKIKSAILLDTGLEAFEAYYRTREEFYNR